MSIKIKIDKKYWASFIIITFLILFSIIGFLKNYYVKKYGIYTIGNVIQIENAARGGYIVDYEYYYKNIKYTSRAGFSELEINKNDVGKNFFVVFLSRYPSLNNVLELVPDCIKNAPPEGWKEVPTCDGKEEMNKK